MNKPPIDTPKRERFSSSAILGLVVANILVIACIAALVVIFCK